VIGFLTVWIFCSLGTVVWILLTESLVVMRRGAAWFMELKKELDETRDSPWWKTALVVFFLWWGLLIIWVMAASKGRSLIEHAVLGRREQKAKLAKARADLQAFRQQLADVKVEEINKRLVAAGLDIRVKVTIPEDPDKDPLVEACGADAERWGLGQHGIRIQPRFTQADVDGLERYRRSKEKRGD
jgi:hypothetical protein